MKVLGPSIALCCFIACFCFAAPSRAAQNDPKLLIDIEKAILKDVNGGVTCATCSVLVGLVEQLSQIYNISIADSIAKFCSFLPSGLNEACKLIVEDFAPSIIKLLEDKETPDIVCNAIDLCKNQTGKICHIFPLPKTDIMAQIDKARYKATISATKSNPKFTSFGHPLHKFVKICNISLLKPICALIERFAGDHLPVDDVDKDLFSDLSTFRGTSWRGKDCDDFDSKVYPGRHTVDDAFTDSNCNGISGRDPKTGETYEALWCKDSQPMGTVLLGDSAGAHFHIPPAWLTAGEMSIDAFQDLLFILENEFDWPQLSSATGYMNSTWPRSISGPVDSTYLKLREINRCNHRDFQSIAVNGARSGAMADEIVKGLARHGNLDNPVFLSLALIGNDVCNGHFGTSHMTTPEEFSANTLRTLKYVDSVVAPGSVVIGVGLVDGRILYDTLHDHVHPIGSLRKDVTYSDLYDYLNCLEVSPCFGWLNSNETWRNLTTERAFQLNAAFKDLAAKGTFVNFKLHYIDPDVKESFDRWVKNGGDPVDLIEPVDGFHPSQQSQDLNTEIMFEKLRNLGVLPPVNQYNADIASKFGDQGGY